MNNYLYAPIIALTCNSFLLLAFIASKKNKLIYSFIYVLILSIMWTGGSLLMRSHFLGLDKLWYDISLFGLIFFTYELLIFVKTFAGVKRQLIDYILLAACAFIVVVNTFTGFFLAMPTVELTKLNQEGFVYHTSGYTSILVIVLTIIIVYILQFIMTHFKGDKAKQKAIMPYKIGLVILFLGHIVVVLPVFQGIPFDIFSGVIFVFLLFYMLYRRRLFRLDLLVSRWVVYAFSGLIAILFLSRSLDPLLELSSKHFTDLKSQSLFIAIIFAVFTLVIYRLMEVFIDKLYVSTEVLRNEALKQLKNEAFAKIKINDISRLIIDAVKNTVDVKEIYVLLPVENEEVFKVIATSNPLNKVDFTMKRDNPLLKYFEDNSEIIFADEFTRLNAFRSMWIEEKKELYYLNIECFVPLCLNHELVGLLMLTEKHKKVKYTYDDVLFLEGINLLASTSYNKALLFEKAYIEARQDDLTKILNRKYFLKEMDLKFNELKGDMLSLALINIDDFTLYNQLYGNNEGDKVLCDIANIIKATTEGIGISARFDSKVFACLLASYDVNQTKSLIEKIVNQISLINSSRSDYKMKKVTVSCGISSIPCLASDTAELIKDCEQAVYYVKRNGKNNIRISTGQLVRKDDVVEIVERKSDIFSEYAPTVCALTAAIDTKDHYTFNHSNNVAYYATSLAQGLKMDDDSIEIIKEAALLHDIGKIGIDEKILNKKGRLTEEERIIMQTHVENSVSIIKHLPSLTYVIPAVIGHHERWDGKGYPRKIKGHDIPLFARILCVADCFDAMLAKRSYKDPQSVDFALGELEKGSGYQFDPELVPIFLDLVKTGQIKPIIDV